MGSEARETEMNVELPPGEGTLSVTHRVHPAGAVPAVALAG